ncbi:MAG: ribonuclease III [Clostridia bacterium]|nr:ribonuclease III [Clostridia bacterium]
MNKRLLAWQMEFGYVFSDLSLLETAFTHSSYSHENKNISQDNERLEFLGDAVLGAVISTLLYRTYPAEREGILSSYRQTIVCEATLAALATRLQVGEMLRLGNGELQHNGRKKRSILADAMEAVVAAVYLDQGAVINETVTTLIERLFTDEIRACATRGLDYKSRLQQVVEQDGGERLEYRVASVTGPVHDPRFTVEARLNSNVIGRASGRSKQEAEQGAAKEALSLFGAE